MLRVQLLPRRSVRPRWLAHSVLRYGRHLPPENQRQDAFRERRRQPISRQIEDPHQNISMRFGSKCGFGHPVLSLRPPYRPARTVLGRVGHSEVKERDAPLTTYFASAELLRRRARLFQCDVQRAILARLQLQQRRTGSIEMMQDEREPVEAPAECSIRVFGTQQVRDRVVAFRSTTNRQPSLTFHAPEIVRTGLAFRRASANFPPSRSCAPSLPVNLPLMASSVIFASSVPDSWNVRRSRPSLKVPAGRAEPLFSIHEGARDFLRVEAKLHREGNLESGKRDRRVPSVRTAGPTAPPRKQPTGSIDKQPSSDPYLYHREHANDSPYWRCSLRPPPWLRRRWWCC